MELKDYVREILLFRGNIAESDDEDDNEDEAGDHPGREIERDEVTRASKKGSRNQIR